MSNVKTITVDGVQYFSEQQASAKNPYCIVRSRDQGVMCGNLVSINGRQVVLNNARQIYRYDSTFVLADIAEHGMRDASKAMLSVAMSEPMYMLEACGVYICTKAAADQLVGIPAQSK